jgi:hypothetical protein
LIAPLFDVEGLSAHIPLIVTGFPRKRSARLDMVRGDVGSFPYFTSGALFW